MSSLIPIWQVMNTGENTHETTSTEEQFLSIWTAN